MHKTSFSCKSISIIINRTLVHTIEKLNIINKTYTRLFLSCIIICDECESEWMIMICKVCVFLIFYYVVIILHKHINKVLTAKIANNYTNFNVNNKDNYVFTVTYLIE